MKRFAISLTLGLALFGAASSSRAQQNAAGDLDHLICYRMKDPLAVPGSFDLLAKLQPEFSRAGCALLRDHQDGQVNSEFCVPASKLNVVSPQHDPTIAGDPLSNDYVCYRIECEAGAKPPHKFVSDQFGSRHVRFGGPTRLCVPATKQPILCGQTDVNNKGVPVCGGLCAQSGSRCQLSKKTGACTCTPATCGGRPDSAGICGGGCANPGDACQPADENRCSCLPRNCGPDSISRQCGGACPVGAQCVTGANGACGCETPPGSGCGLDPATGSCGGDCPDGLYCLPPSSGGDSCLCRESGGLG